VLARQALYDLSHFPSPALVIFEIWSHFMSVLVWTIILLFVLPAVAGMTGMHHCAQSLVEMGSCDIFCLDWP
jgi:hypothetical protein